MDSPLNKLLVSLLADILSAVQLPSVPFFTRPNGATVLAETIGIREPGLLLDFGLLKITYYE